MPGFMKSELLYVVLRLLVAGTLLTFIVVMERAFSRTGIGGRRARIFELIAAFLLGIALRGLLVVLTG
jgi:hypothetical protein